MSSKQKAVKSKKLDILKWVAVFLLLIFGIAANYYFIQIPLTLRILGWVILSVLAVVIALNTDKGRKVWKFFKESRNEIRKVVWPSRQQTFQTTLIVLAMVFAFALIMWGIDAFLMWAISWLTGQRG